MFTFSKPTGSRDDPTCRWIQRCVSDATLPSLYPSSRRTDGAKMRALGFVTGCITTAVFIFLAGGGA